jgi:hypothetical protein
LPFWQTLRSIHQDTQGRACGRSGSYRVARQSPFFHYKAVLPGPFRPRDDSRNGKAHLPLHGPSV